MSVLRDIDLIMATAGDSPRLGIEPLTKGMVQPASIDLRLDNRFLTFLADWTPIDPRVEQEMVSHEVPDGVPFRLPPGGFALGSTIEKVTIGRNLAARIEGKSSLGRLGIEVHSTAGWIDPGFRGHITLEIKNVSPRPVLLIPGMWIAQLAAFELTGYVTSPYGEEQGSHYQDQPRGPVASRAHLQFEASARR